MAATEPIRNKNQLRQLAEHFLKRGQLRNYVLVVLGVHTALRISDLLRLKWDDVFDFETNEVRKFVSVTEKKTRKEKIIALNAAAVNALSVFAVRHSRPGRFLLENPRTRQAISRVQAYRLIRAASEVLRFPARLSCHSLRKTFGYHAWKEGISPAVIMEIYNHSSLAVTRRYLGVTQDDKNEVYLKLGLIA